VINQCVRTPFGLTSDATGGRSRLIDMVAVHMYSASEVGVQNCFGMLQILSAFAFLYQVSPGVMCVFFGERELTTLLTK